MKGQKMDLFGIRAAREERLRKEAAAATRQELISALAGLPPFITERVTKWYRTLIATVSQAASQWFESRAMEQQQALNNRLQERVTLLLKQMPIAMIQKLAETHRQTLITNVSEQGRALFTAGMQRRSAELLLAVREDVERSRSTVNSGEDSLPNGTRFFFRNANGSRLYVIEQPPAVRTVQFGNREEPRSYQKYRLSFPFSVFIICFNRGGDFSGLYVFFRNERLKNIKDTLYAAALPNTTDGSCVCFPGLLREDSGISLGEKAERVLDSFWGSGFNGDLSDTFRASMQRIDKIRSLDHWQNESARDPRFVLSLKWLPSRFGTLDEYVRRVSDHGQRTESDPLHVVSESLNRVAERVGGDIMEAALQLIPGWKIEEVPSKVLKRDLKKLFSEGAEDIKGMVAEAAKEIFAQVPTLLDYAAAQGEQFRTRLVQEVDDRVKWIGLVQDASPHESTDLRTRRVP